MSGGFAGRLSAGRGCGTCSSLFTAVTGSGHSEPPAAGKASKLA